jgi:hypothetical protein
MVVMHIVMMMRIVSLIPIYEGSTGHRDHHYGIGGIHGIPRVYGITHHHRVPPNRGPKGGLIRRYGTVPNRGLLCKVGH